MGLRSGGGCRIVEAVKERFGVWLAVVGSGSYRVERIVLSGFKKGERSGSPRIVQVG